MKFLRQFHCRAAWPPFWLVVIFAFFYIGFNGSIWLIRHTTRNYYELIANTPENVQAFMAIIGIGAGCHALYRFLRFHPACNSAYASWLSLSPWTAAKPLPLGPIHPVWQDAAVLGLLCALCRWQPRINPALPLEAFGLTWLAGLTFLLAFTRTWFPFFATGFLWPSLLLTNRGWTLAAILLALAGLLWAGTRRSLRTFPWREINRTHPGLSKFRRQNSALQIEIRLEVANPSAARGASLGWPFLHLSPKVHFESVSLKASFWVSLLLGWWVFCLMIGLAADTMPVMVLVVGLLVAFVRFITYLMGVAPSFSFRSRPFFGQWIVPGFDQIFLTPLLAVGASILGGVVAEKSGSWYPEAHAFFAALICFILLAGGPTRRNWILTGNHRFRPQFSGQQPIRPI